MKAPSPAKLLEKQVSDQVRSFLEYRGWRIVRNNVTKFPGGNGRWVQVGEVGMADLLALRYLPEGRCLALWLELKRPGRKPDPHQIAWHDKERLRGATVWRVNELREFIEAYERAFGWVHTDDCIPGQKAIQFQERESSGAAGRVATG